MVPVDLVGGTSIGAVLAALVAMGLDPTEIAEFARRQFRSLFDPTLPIVSLLAGRRIQTRLSDTFGAIEIEDLATPFFCVSTNLTQALEVVHRHGPLAKAVRASISLPGILPPVASGGDLLVDGGLTNNLPIDLTRNESDREYGPNSTSDNLSRDYKVRFTARHRLSSKTTLSISSGSTDQSAIFSATF